MSEPLDIDPEAFLARLAQLDMAAAEHTHAKLMAAESVEDVAQAGRTYQRAARSLRQSLRLLSQLRRESAAGARQAALEAEAVQAKAQACAPKPRPPVDPDLVKRRELEAALVPELYAAFERSEAREYEDEVDDYIAEVWTRDFARLPLDAQLAGLITYIRTGEHPKTAARAEQPPTPSPSREGQLGETEPGEGVERIPSPPREGQTAKPSGWGSVDRSAAPAGRAPDNHVAPRSSA